MRRFMIRWLLPLAAIAFMAGLYVLGTIDAYQVNLRYILWKHHLWPHQRFMLSFLSSDGDFVMSLQGKTKAEIQGYFPRPEPPRAGDHWISASLQP